MDWNVDFKELITFLGKTIYKPENVLVELCANSYDADATLVDISTRGGSEQILIKDDGCGMDRDDLKELTTLAKSKKRDMIEKGEKTPKFDRKLLGSFGIGIVSFLSLGDFIRVFTAKENNEPLFFEIKKTYDEEEKLVSIDISDADSDEEYRQHLLIPEHGTTVEINNRKLNITGRYDLIRYKLSNLPLYDDFKITLNNLEIKKEDFDPSSWMKKEFSFTLDNIDPSYESRCVIYANHQDTIESYKRGVYLVVNGRVIEKDLFSDLYPELDSPGTIAARARGYIEADYLHQSIQASREDFFDSEIINEIRNKIRNPLNELTNDFKVFRTSEDMEKSYAELLQRVEKAKNKYSAPNQFLNELGISFFSRPEYEQEVVLIIAQLCQLNLLPFRILDYNSASHIDCIVKWPLEQKRRDPDFITELEVETSLDKFFDHDHDFRTKPDICCWGIQQGNFNRKKERYLSAHPESIESIVLIDASDEDKVHFGHQKEIHFTIREADRELRTIILRVYVLFEIVELLYNEREE